MLRGRGKLKPVKNLNKGDRFNHLTFTGNYIYSEKEKRWVGIYLCECGRTCEARNDNVINGRTKSCACKSNAPDWRQVKSDYGELYPFYIILSRIQKSAQQRDITLEITEQDIKDLWIKQNGRCFYTGEQLILPNSFPEYDKNPKTPSIDRIDSTKSYTKDNIQIVLKVVNYMKLESTHEEFINRCKLVTSYRGSK